MLQPQIVNNLKIHKKEGDMKKVLSEVSGSVWKLEVAVGQSVQAGDTLLIVESMKMEIPVESPASGTVTELLVAEGDSVADGQWLVRLD
jgi:acetyl-CoA carboxylase biotin carboxyl carrier protein